MAVEEDFLDCLNLEDGTVRPSRNVSNYQPTQRNNPEVPRPQEVCYYLIASFESKRCNHYGVLRVLRYFC